MRILLKIVTSPIKRSYYYVNGRNGKYFKGCSMIFLSTAVYISNTEIKLMANILFVSNQVRLKDHPNHKNSGMLMHFYK